MGKNNCPKGLAFDSTSGVGFLDIGSAGVFTSGVPYMLEQRLSSVEKELLLLASEIQHKLERLEHAPPASTTEHIERRTPTPAPLPVLAAVAPPVREVPHDLFEEEVKPHRLFSERTATQARVDDYGQEILSLAAAARARLEQVASSRMTPKAEIRNSGEDRVGPTEPAPSRNRPLPHVPRPHMPAGQGSRSASSQWSRQVTGWGTEDWRSARPTMRYGPNRPWRPTYQEEAEELSTALEDGWDGEEDSSGEIETSGSDVYGGLDANLVSSLLRWVANVKRRLGVRQMVELLEIYKLTGYLPPVVENIIVRVANLAVLPDESEGQVVTVDDLVDLYLMLHGIIMGAGEIPEEIYLPDETLVDLSQVVLDRRLAPIGQPVWKPARPTAAPDWREAAVADLGTVVAEQAPSPLSHPIRTIQKPGASEPPPRFRAVRSTSPEEALNTLIASLSGAFGGSEEPARPVQKVSQIPAQPFVRQAQTTRGDYLSDLTDGEWSSVEHLVPAPKTGGRPSKYDRRAIVNAILHALSTKCSWRMLPDYLPPWKIVHHYYSVWRDDGSWDAVVAVLGEQRIYSGRTGSGTTVR